MKSNAHISALTMRAVVYALLLITTPSGMSAQSLQMKVDSTAQGASLSAPDKREVADDPADTTDYESTRSTPYEQAALVGANVILVPIAVSAVILSVIPPTLGMVVDDGVAYASVGFETGIGFGPKKETGRFAKERLMLDYTHVYALKRHDLWRIEAVKDIDLFFLDRRKILSFGVSPLLGLYTNGPERGYSIGSTVRVMLPSLPYVGMFPLHTFGVTYRYNKTFGGVDFYTLALGFSSAFIF